MTSQSPSRIVHFHSGNIFGGIEQVLVTLAQSGKGHRFLLCFGGHLADRLREVGVDLHIVGPVRLSRPSTLRAVRRQLADFVTPEDRIVVCHSPWDLAVAGPSARPPLGFWAHGVISGRHPVDVLARRVKPALLLANSRFTARSLRAVFPAQPVEVVHPPLSHPPSPGPDTRDRIRRAMGVAPNEVVIAQIGRPEPGKGWLLHLAALERFREVTGWRLWLIGGPQSRAEMRHFDKVRRAVASRRLGDRVMLLGLRQDVQDLLTAADIYCQPNVRPEGFGLTLIEAMRAGRPVVTTTLGAAPELVDTTCGILVPPEQPPALARALQALIDDAGQRAALGQAGIDRARHLSDPGAQTRQFERLVREPHHTGL